jgi:hypothetical protein
VIKGIKYAYLIKAYRDDNGNPKQKSTYLGRADKIRRGIK